MVKSHWMRQAADRLEAFMYKHKKMLKQFENSTQPYSLANSSNYCVVFDFVKRILEACLTWAEPAGWCGSCSFAVVG